MNCFWQIFKTIKKKTCRWTKISTPPPNRLCIRILLRFHGHLWPPMIASTWARSFYIQGWNWNEIKNELLKLKRYIVIIIYPLIKSLNKEFGFSWTHTTGSIFTWLLFSGNNILQYSRFWNSEQKKVLTTSYFCTGRKIRIVRPAKWSIMANEISKMHPIAVGHKIAGTKINGWEIWKTRVNWGINWLWTAPKCWGRDELGLKFVE